MYCIVTCDKSQDLIILHGGSGVARGGSFNLERGGKEEKEVKVPTTATLTKPLLPGLTIEMK